MESSKQAIVVASPAVDDQLPQLDSPFSSLIFDISQQIQEGMEDLLKMTNEIDVLSAEIAEDVEKCKEAALERTKAIEEETACFQNAAYAVLDVLSIECGKQDQMLLLESETHHEL
ncbi:hypothetical protein Droror1_Dr00017219 [Drosera rotundifolia]